MENKPPTATPADTEQGTNHDEATAGTGASVAGHVARGAGAVLHELGERRGLRAVLAGVVLLLIALFAGMDSALTIPIVIVGVLLIAMGSLGPRMSGRFAVEFGASGTVIELKTEITPPGTVASEHNRTMELPATVEPDDSPISLDTPDAEVIEGTGETIEIDVSELEALVEAAQSANGNSGQEPARTTPPV